jgi:tetratricopeptide (TPR) repeat protein
MKIFSAAAIVVLAGSGLAAQDQAQSQPQSYLEQFQAILPTLEKLWSEMAYKEIIDKVEAILPAATPAFNKDPENPMVGISSYEELYALQSLHTYIGRAYAMNGGYEKAILNFQKAEEIAVLNATEIDDVIPALIDQWNMSANLSKQELESVAKLMEQKKELEAIKRPNKAQKDMLANLEKNVMPMIEARVPVWEEQIQRAPVIIERLEEMLSHAKSFPGKFVTVIESIQNDIKGEKELIDSKFGGDKAKYVDSVLGTKENFESLPTQADKLKFLYRLMYLDPQSEAVKKQIDIVLGRG